MNWVDPLGLVPPGMNIFTWWIARVVVGAAIGIPMTVGAGIDLIFPTELNVDEEKELKHAQFMYEADMWDKEFPKLL